MAYAWVLKWVSAFNCSHRAFFYFFYLCGTITSEALAFFGTSTSEIEFLVTTLDDAVGGCVAIYVFAEK